MSVSLKKKKKVRALASFRRTSRKYQKNSLSLSLSSFYYRSMRDREREFLKFPPSHSPRRGGAAPPLPWTRACAEQGGRL